MTGCGVKPQSEVCGDKAINYSEDLAQPGVHYSDSAKASMQKIKLIMDKFQLSSIKLTPTDTEEVKFFRDTATFDGKDYYLEGAEYVSPCTGTRCPYARTNAPREVELALHVMGKFRYALWGGKWMCRGYEQMSAGEECPFKWETTGEQIKIALPQNMSMFKYGSTYVVYEWRDYVTTRVEERPVQGAFNSKEVETRSTNVTVQDFDIKKLRDMGVAKDGEIIVAAVYQEQKLEQPKTYMGTEAKKMKVTIKEPRRMWTMSRFPEE